MNSSLSLIVALVFSPFILFFLHVCISRLALLVNGKISSAYSVALAIAMGFIVILGFSWVAYFRFSEPRQERFLGLFYCAVVYGCFSYAYLHLFYMGETARRLHILYELKLHGCLTREQLTQHYGAQTMLEVRLDRLVAMGQLKREGDRYVVQKRFLCWASGILMAWSKLIGFHSEALK